MATTDLGVGRQSTDFASSELSERFVGCIISQSQAKQELGGWAGRC